MYKIQTNQSGTRNIEVSEENLATLEKYNLLQCDSEFSYSGVNP